MTRQRPGKPGARHTELDQVLDSAMSGILAKLEASFDPGTGLADIYARSARSRLDPAQAAPGRDMIGGSRLEEACDQIDLLASWLTDLIRSGHDETPGGSSFLELARDNLVQLRAGLAARTMARPEAQQLAGDIDGQLSRADQILRTQHATTLNRRASECPRRQETLTSQVQLMREMIARLYEPDGHDVSLTPAR